MIKSIIKNDFVVLLDGLFLDRQLFLIYDKDEKILRRRSIKSHIKSDDYFGTLATVIDLARQEKKKTEIGHNQFFKNLRDDLIYLQKNYKIVKRNK